MGLENTNFEQMSSDLALEALGRVLSRSGLAPEAKPAQILNYIVRETIEGRGHLIKGFSIGQDVFGKGDDFDPVTDSSVRVEMKKLREALDHYYRTAGSEDPVRIEVLKGSYKPRFVQQATQGRLSNKKTIKGFGLAGLALCFLIAAVSFGDGQFGKTGGDGAQVDGEPVILLTGAGDARRELAIAKQNLSRFHNFKLIEAAGGKFTSDQVDYELMVRGTSTGTFTELIHFETREIVSNDFFTEMEIGAFDSPDVLTPYRLWLSTSVARNGKVETDIRTRGNAKGDFFCSSLTEYYFSNQTDENHLAARDCIDGFLNNGHETARLYSDLALITREEHSDQRNLLPGDPLGRAAAAARRAISIDPFDPQTHYSLMTVLFMTGAVEEATTAGEKAFELNPFDAEVAGGFASRLNVVGAHARASELFALRSELTPSRPSWAVFGSFLAEFAQGNRLVAAEIAESLAGSENTLHLTAVAIGASIQGNDEKARAAKSKIAQKEPDFRNMFERRNYVPELVDSLEQALEEI